ncbi:MAG: hypothetical protein M3Y27_18585 [Acidobacteriota bacterium]|nr:hypothetical protein [Acidobacteriota bacterium]
MRTLPAYQRGRRTDQGPNKNIIPVTHSPPGWITIRRDLKYHQHDDRGDKAYHHRAYRVVRVFSQCTNESTSDEASDKVQARDLNEREVVLAKVGGSIRKRDDCGKQAENDGISQPPRYAPSKIF